MGPNAIASVLPHEVFYNESTGISYFGSRAHGHAPLQGQASRDARVKNYT
jgi:hypothetical protein